MKPTFVFQENFLCTQWSVLFLQLRSRLLYCLCFGLLLNVAAVNAQYKQKTFCNPINIDYGYTPIPNFSEWGQHRATADPVIVTYKNDYYLFSTNQWGYWWSSDMLKWNFVSKKFLRPWNAGYDELCAPAVGIIGDTMIVFGSTYNSNFTIWMSTNPKANEWKPLVDSFDMGGWDPSFFTDDDGKLYMYNGSSNRYPLYGIELNRKTLVPKGYRKEMYFLEQERYGWQRFGENLDNTFLDPFIEGAWMTKHNNKYYLQYGAPGTEFSGYADGVVVGDSPLGPFTPQSDPLSYKPGGFSRGAGHGATFKDVQGNYWHVATSIICVKNTFERRIGIWPAGFDKDDVMWCNTAFGDYPHYLQVSPTASPNPSEGGASHSANTEKSFELAETKNPPSGGRGAFLPTGRGAGFFPGWMLLNYKKPVLVSSTLGTYNANNAVDENIKTYWSAASAGKGEYIISDLGNMSTVNAIQINYADQDVDSSFLGKSLGVFHQYKLYYSADGKKWIMLADKSNNKTDVPHDYVELEKPVEARFIKLENIHMPTGKFAISGLRIFGNGNGQKPAAVGNFIVLRTEKDKRSAYIKWKPSDNAYAYNIYYGTHPDKLYSCIMVHDFNEYWFKTMDKEKTYYFTIEAINENGVSPKTPVLKSE
ncbi:MAG: family 43 glycosylhydrolase [Ferruginibacter sp.]|nr:family 43 glycosylhydrolase [Ferruginibacter sp.]